MQEYLKMKLHRSQIGFVDGMDIIINIWRALDRIQEIRAQKKICYCLFLDFQSAYNTIPHTLLFEKLQKVLNENEIQLIRKIYSRTKITLGNRLMQPNVGVAQGSVISPALFNIFAESLLNELQESGYNINDLLAFADDHIIMNLTKSDLRRAIKLVKEWSHHNNFSLNPDKSGILEIPPRNGALTMEIGSRFEGIPIVSEYRYLGLLLDNKMTGEAHLNKLFGSKDTKGTKHPGKIEFIRNNLSPLTRHISLDYRVNLWQVLIRPLFTPLALFSAYLSESRKLMLERKLKKSLKWFLGLTKNTPDEVLFYIVNIDFDKWGKYIRDKARAKWKGRINNEESDFHDKFIISTNSKWLPREVSQFVNLQNAVCTECNYILNAEHYQKHGISVPRIFELLEEVNRNVDEERIKSGRELKREEGIRLATSIINVYITKMKRFLDKQSLILS